MQQYSMPIRDEFSNKGTFGKILNFAGSKNYIGASFLSSASSLKVGAGFVALSSEKEIIKSVSTLLPECVFLSRKEGLSKINDFTVVMIGCGLGQSLQSKQLFRRVCKKLQKSDVPFIIDADGLNILAEKTLKLPQKTILTPHPLEASRLLGISLKCVLDDLEGTAKKLVGQYDCTVVLKTHRTIIADKNSLLVNQFGNSALAKAGSGDVLAGVIAGLLAQGMLPFEASKLGVYLHSKAGEIASQALTEYSVLASEQLNYLPLAIQTLQS